MIATAPTKDEIPATQVKAVLFDLDGVLINSVRGWYQVLRQGARACTGREIGFSEFEKTFGQGPKADRQEFFPDWTQDQVTKFYLETFPNHVDQVDVMDGALELLGKLKSCGIKRAVVTNTPRVLADKVLALKAIAPLLDTYAAAGDAPEKPAPDLVNLVLNQLQLCATDVLYVGDSESDHLAAQAAGVKMVGLNRPGHITVTALMDILHHLTM